MVISTSGCPTVKQSAGGYPRTAVVPFGSTVREMITDGALRSAVRRFRFWGVPDATGGNGDNSPAGGIWRWIMPESPVRDKSQGKRTLATRPHRENG
jgi:hypothetical protein